MPVTGFSDSKVFYNLLQTLADLDNERNSAIIGLHLPLLLEHLNASHRDILLTNMSACPRGVVTHFLLCCACMSINMAAPKQWQMR